MQPAQSATVAPLDGGPRAALTRAMDDMVAAGATGVLVRVHDRLGVWSATAGVARRGRPDPVPEHAVFRIGSVTKTFVAAIVLMLAAEGELDLDDPVDRYLPRFGLDGRITVRMLLLHVSGLYNYSGKHQLDRTVQPGLFPTTGDLYVRQLTTSYTPDELVRFALDKPAYFAPGEGFAYSNTNYVLIGLLIEEITGEPYAQQVYRRIVRPLGLSDTTVPGHDTAIPGPHAHGYLGYRLDGQPQVADVTRSNPSWYGAAGEIISSARDLDVFLAALLDGRLLPPRALAEITSFTPPPPDPGVSPGLFRRQFAPDRTGIGHFGSVPGYICHAYSTFDGAARLVVSATKGAVDRFDPAAFSVFQTAMDRALVACFSSLVLSS
ncbi:MULTISPECIES: serine hydrolase domain-containing protein [unclassified Streptomyces]|uniref:serine hydrolase domain-containing protein n=1 Tax=unclassified Streptomyces TaxID=2593676 RepID=UPI0003829C8D|nr:MULTISPECIES: serine hydrolase domain-containing protein [unclassified Streptomyces]MYT32505.1 serine hydrolase [Streptomyces sp. SID8354]